MTDGRTGRGMSLTDQWGGTSELSKRFPGISAVRMKPGWAQMSRGHVEAVSALFSAISPDTKSPMKAWNALQAVATHCSPVVALASRFPYRPALSQAPRYAGFLMSSKDWSGHTRAQADHETRFKQRPLKLRKHVLLWLLFLVLLTLPLLCSARGLARTLTMETHH